MSDNELLLTTLTNPVDPLAREITPIAAVPGATLADYIAGALPAVADDLDLVASVNGGVVDDWQAYLPQPGDSIVLMVVPHGGGGGGGKDIVRTVALLAVMITAPGIGQALVPGALMQYPLAVAGIKAAVGLAGGMLVNAILPPAVPDLPAFSPADLGEYSPTYAWNTIGNLDIEGKAWPALYGTMRVYPYLISQHITTDGDQQYLNLLYAVADHAVDSITDIEINGNPSTYYDGIEIETRLGSNSQTAISYFNDTISEKASGAKLSTSWTTIRTDSNVVEGLGVAVSCPGGLYYANDQGSLSEQTLRIAIEHKKVGDVSWTAWDEETITEAIREPVRRVFRKDDLTAGEYDVRVKFAAEPNTGARYGTIAYCDYIQEVVYDDFAYPGTSLLAIRALATDQLSGAAPRVSCLATRSTVDVYEPGTGWTTKPANLPPWASYDAHVNGDYGGNVAYGRMLYDEFDEWASYCSANSLYLNLYLDSGMTTPKALEQIGTPGRGQVLQRGTKFGCVVDKPVSRSGLYGMGNIVRGSFEETFLEKKDRANVVEITYFDADLEYTRQTIRLFAGNYDPTTDEENVSSIVLYGCTSKTQAIKHGTFVLNCNQHLLRVIRFDAVADAIGCQVGDMIEFAHDVPQWGTSGRLVSATSTGAYLDRDITMVAGQTYKLMVRHYNTDVIEEVTIEASDYTGRQVTIAGGGTWSQTPQFCDVYSFGLSTNVTKQFRVINITRSTKMHRKLTALEYKADVYSDSGTLPAFETPATFNFVQELTATEIWRDGTGQGVIHMSWRGEAILWSVFYRVSGTSHWIKAGDTGQRGFDVAGLVPGQSYEFSVTGTTTPGNVSGISMSTSATFTGWGNLTLDAPVISGLQIVDQANDTEWAGKHLKLTWNPIVDAYTPADDEVNGASTFHPYAEIAHYRLNICETSGTLRREVNLHDNFFDYTYEMNVEDGKSSSLLVKVWAVLKSGAVSSRAAILNVSNPAPSAVTGLQVQGTGSTTQWAGRDVILTWGGASDTDLADYKVMVKNGDDSERRTEYVKTPFYVYSRDKNIEDGESNSIKVTVQARDEFGSLSTATTISVSNPAPAAVSNLQVQGTGSTTQWAGNDVILTWDASTDADIDDYKVVVKNADLSERRTEYVKAPHYVYSRDKNIEDTLSNSLVVTVQARDEFGSLATAGSITLSNPAPAIPSGLTATPFMGGVQFSWTPNTEADISYYEYRVNVGGAPAGGWSEVKGFSRFKELTESEKSTYGSTATVYFEVRAVDSFGTASGAASANGSAQALGVNVSDIENFVITASKTFLKIPIPEGDTWSNNTPVAGYVTWSAHTLYYNGAAYAIAGGNTNLKYIYWLNGAGTYTASDTNPTLGDGDFIIATNVDGAHDLAWNAMANQIVGSSYLQNAAIVSAKIANLAVQNAHINDVSAEKINAGYLDVLNRIQAGSMVVSKFATDATGRMFDSATRDFADLGGATKPEDSATLGAAWGSNLTGRPAELTDGRIASALHSGGYLQTKVLPGSNIGTPAGAGLYLGADYLGYYSGSAWTAYIDSNGYFTFKKDASNYISWSGANLDVKGSITITGGSGIANLTDAGALAVKNSVDLATSEVLNKSLANVDSAANTKLGTIATGADVTAANTAAAITGQGALATKSAVDLATAEVTNKSLANVDATANTKLTGIETGATVGAAWGSNLTGRPTELTDGRIASALHSGGYLQTKVLPGSNVGTPAGAGLYLGADYLGYYSGSAWTAYIDSNGYFTFKKDASNYISWTGANLDVKGSITITGGSGIANLTDAGALAAKDSVDLATSEVLNKSLGNVDSAANTKLGTIATGADVTAANTAAAIAGQGALATKSAVDLATAEVTNKSLANVDATANTKLGTIATGADVTAANTAAAIAGQGALATKSAVDLATAEVTNKSLANVDATANTKLTGIATGATVGAAWGSNLTGRPTELTDGRISTALHSGGYLQTKVLPGSNIGTPAGAGLYLGADYMGYYSGTAWSTYMDSSGNWKLSGDANNYLSWNGSTLGISTNKTDAIVLESGGNIRVNDGGDVQFHGSVGTSNFMMFYNSDPALCGRLTMDYGNQEWEFRTFIEHALVLDSAARLDILARAGNISLTATDDLVASPGKITLSGDDDVIFDVGIARPNSNKGTDLGTSSIAFDDAYADDFHNVADFPFLDERLDRFGNRIQIDDLQIIRNIGHSGNYDPRTGLAIQDDDTLPDWIYSVYKDDFVLMDENGNIRKWGIKGQKALDPDGKPFLSLKTGIALAWGGVRQLDNDFRSEITALKNEIASLKQVLAA